MTRFIVVSVICVFSLAEVTRADNNNYDRFDRSLSSDILDHLQLIRVAREALEPRFIVQEFRKREASPFPKPQLQNKSDHYKHGNHLVTHHHKSHKKHHQKNKSQQHQNHNSKQHQKNNKPAVQTKQKNIAQQKHQNSNNKKIIKQHHQQNHQTQTRSKP